MDQNQAKEYLAIEKMKLSADRMRLKYDIMQLAVATIDKIGGGKEAEQDPGTAVVKMSGQFFDWISKGSIVEPKAIELPKVDF